jgi:hypothetical protein
LEREEGGIGEEAGAFIGVAGASSYAGSKGGGEINGDVTSGREGNGRRLMEELTGWSHLSACRREGENTASGFNPGWAVGCMRDWAKIHPRGPFLFLFSSSFPFLFSYFFYIFCKTFSNQFKPLSEIF